MQVVVQVLYFFTVQSFGKQKSNQSWPISAIAWGQK